MVLRRIIGASWHICWRVGAGTVVHRRGRVVVVCCRIGATRNIGRLGFVSGRVGGKHALVGQDDHASSRDLQSQVGRIEGGRTKDDRMVGVHGIQGHGAGRWASVESNKAGGVHRGALVDEHVRRAVD